MPMPAPLTVADVQRSGGWNLAYARILALGSSDGYGFSVVDGNGDGRECYQDYWRWTDGGWAPQGGIGGGYHPHGVCEWSDHEFELRAAYGYTDDDPEQLDPGAIIVGTVTITVIRIPLSLEDLISGFLDRVPVGSVDDLELALVLVENGEPALALRELVTLLAAQGVALTRDELGDLALLAAKHGLFDDEWRRLEQLPDS